LKGCDYAAAPDALLPDAPLALPEPVALPELVDSEPVVLPVEPVEPLPVEPLGFVGSPVLPGSALLPPEVSVPPFGVVVLPVVVPDSGFVSGFVSGLVSVELEGFSGVVSVGSVAVGFVSVGSVVALVTVVTMQVFRMVYARSGSSEVASLIAVFHRAASSKNRRGANETSAKPSSVAIRVAFSSALSIVSNEESSV